MINAPLPPCTETVQALKQELNDWQQIGSLKDGHLQALAFKTKVGEDEVYVHFILTPMKSIADGIVSESAPSSLCCSYQSYWRKMDNLTCQQNGVTTYVLSKHFKQREKI